MASIIVGRSENPRAKVRLNDPSVSFDHLEVSFVDSETLWIKDMNSTNHVYVSDVSDGIMYRILETKFKRHQDIKIGHQKMSGDQFFLMVRPHLLPEKVIWYDEFRDLEQHFKSFSKKLTKITQKHQLYINLVRSSFVGVIIVLFGIYGEQLGLHWSLRILGTTIGSTIAILITPKLFPNDTIREERNNLRKQYSKILKCPRCERDLTSSTLQYCKEVKGCATCHARWYP